MELCKKVAKQCKKSTKEVEAKANAKKAKAKAKAEEKEPAHPDFADRYSEGHMLPVGHKHTLPRAEKKKKTRQQKAKTGL